MCMDGHIQCMHTRRKLFNADCPQSEVEHGQGKYTFSFTLNPSYLYVLFQLCMAGADHADAGLPFQLALLIVIGYTRGHTHATSCRAFTPFSGLNDAVVPCALRLDTLISYFSIC